MLPRPKSDDTLVAKTGGGCPDREDKRCPDGQDNNDRPRRGDIPADHSTPVHWRYPGTQATALRPKGGSNSRSSQRFSQPPTPSFYRANLMTTLSEPLSMHRKHRHWRMMAGLPGEPFRLNASPGVSSRVRRDSSQCRCRCSLQLSATSCRLPSPTVVALDSLRRRSQHDAIGATKAPLVEEGRVPGVRYRSIAAEGGVIKETAAWAVFKLRSGALFSLGHEEGRDWPRFGR